MLSKLSYLNGIRDKTLYVRRPKPSPQRNDEVR